MSFVPPAGWYQDPSGGTARRWWDGGQWTEHLEQQLPPVPAMAPAYAASTDQYAVANGYVSQAATSSVHTPTAPAEPNVYSTAGRLAHQYSRDPMIQQTRAQYASWGASVDPRSLPVWTPAVWVIALVPVWAEILLIAGLAVLISQAARVTSSAQLQQLPLQFVYVVGGVWAVTFVVCFVCAFVDRAGLLRRGYARAASVAWMLLTPLGYVIARRVVMKGQTGRGDAPSNVLGGLLLAGVVLGIVLRVLGVASTLG